ncbi:Nif11 domain-containing protein [Candidatus Electrothrix laxa]
MGERRSAALSTNLQKAVQWIGRFAQDHPGKQRNQVINDAQLRFDLTPAESEFLNHNFKGLTTERERGKE